MDEIRQLRSDIVALKESLGHRSYGEQSLYREESFYSEQSFYREQSFSREQSSLRKQSPDMRREWRFERNTVELECEYQDKQIEDDIEGMEEEEEVGQEQDKNYRQLQLYPPRERKRWRENPFERLRRFE